MPASVIVTIAFLAKNSNPSSPNWARTSGGVGMAPIDSVEPFGVFRNEVAATNHQIKMMPRDPRPPEIHFLLFMTKLLVF
jgi:hypothetical protein